MTLLPAPLPALPLPRPTGGRPAGRGAGDVRRLQPQPAGQLLAGLAGALADKPVHGGEARVRLTQALGLAELGVDVHLVDSADLAGDAPRWTGTTRWSPGPGGPGGPSCWT